MASSTEQPGSEVIKVLLVEDALEYAELLGNILAAAGEAKYQLKHVTRLSEGINLLNRESFNLILLDLNLPDSRGYDTFSKIYHHSPEIPIIIMTALDDDRLALKAVREGAQDYLDKGQINGKSMLRAVNYAIERHRKRSEIQMQTLVDDLTGLYNRRGFLSFSNEYLRLSERANRCLLLLFVDLDGLKNINDRFGHQMGDQALVDVGTVLKNTFREADIIARIGGDEFAVLALDIPEEMGEAILKRLYEKLDNLNSTAGHPYRLYVSVGITSYRHEQPSSIEELLHAADVAMYSQKRKKRNQPGV